MSENPFASPQVTDTVLDAKAEDDSACEGVSRDGEYLIARSMVARFPTPCIVCGRDTECQPMSCRVRRRPGVLQFIVPVLGYLSDSVTIRPSVCALHRRQENSSRLVGHVMIILAIGLILVPALQEFSGAGIDESVAFLPVLAFPLGFAWMYYRIFRPRILYAEQIHKRDAWLIDVHASVLRQVPSLPNS